MWLACGPVEICAATDVCPERVLVTMARVANPGSFTFSVSNAVLNAGIWEVPLPPGSMIAQIDADGNIPIAVSSLQATDVPFAFSQNVLGSDISVSGTATVASGSVTGSLDPGSGTGSLATSLFASITFTATIIGVVVYSGTCSIGGSAPADRLPVTLTTGPPGTRYSQQTGAVTLAANLGSPMVCAPALPPQLNLFTDNIQLIVPGTITPILRQGTPVVTGVAPASGSTAGGTLVMVTGSGFTGAVTAVFGGVPGAGLNVVSDTQLTVTSPPGAGTVDVTVTTTAGTSAASAADQFTYVTAPVVTVVFPASGGLAGGTVVTVTGGGFTGAIMAGFGGVPGSGLNVVSDTQLTVTSPPGTISGPVDVMVATPVGTSAISPADQFIYA
jgi:IPT/TIG domain